MAKRAKKIYICECCDAPLDSKRKYCNDRCEQIHLCMSTGTTKYKTKFVAPLFQKMIRAEYGALPAGYSMACVKGTITGIWRMVGHCVCVTCGRLCPWESGGGESQLHCGHFLAGRGSILFEEDCVSTQCASCNRHHSGRPQEFRQWMLAVRGVEIVERLEQLKRQPKSFTRDELVDMRVSYKARLGAAIAKMKNVKCEKPGL